MTLIDIGSNLTHESFAPDLDAVLARARAAGVAQQLVTGASRAGSIAARDLAQRYLGELFATAGVHPHHASEYTAEADALLRDLLRDGRVLAVGECGLDFNRNFSPRPAQLRAFELQLQIAVDCGKPLFLHQRDAHDDFLACMKNAGALPRAVVHCFTGEKRELYDYLDRDWYIGITGWLCDERRGKHLRELVRDIPAQRLMVETDSPYLLPRNLVPMPAHRRNEPMYLRHIVEELARDRAETFDDCAAATVATAREFFALPVLTPA